MFGTTVERSVADLRMIMKEQQNEVTDVEGGCVWALISKALYTEKPMKIRSEIVMFLSVAYALSVAPVFQRSSRSSPGILTFGNERLC